MGFQKLCFVSGQLILLVIFCIYVKPVTMVGFFEREEYCGVLLSQYGNNFVN